ncbi:MAG: hypothetical protein E3J96_05570 [Sulfurovum sp.]|nr:MAG: hypothetical protein E3J96_05570 [Sulfurovum sp.]
MKINKKYIFTYLILAGFSAYLISVMLSAVFIAPLETDKGWCLKFMEIEGPNYAIERVCTEFKDNLEKAKHFHNLDMIDRNSNLHLGVFFFFLSLSTLIFYFIPKWYGKIPAINYTSDNTVANFINTFGLLLIINYVVVYIISLIIGYILPPPSEWFPDIFDAIHTNQVAAALLEAKDIASNL